MSFFEGTWNMLIKPALVEQKTCCPFRVAHMQTTPPGQLTVVMRGARGSGSHDDRGTRIGLLYESHHSMHCVTNASMLAGQCSASKRRKADSIKSNKAIRIFQIGEIFC